MAALPTDVLGLQSDPGPTIAPVPQTTTDATPTPLQRPAAVAAETPKVVPVKRLLELDERLGLLQQRIEELAEHAPNPQAAEALKRLHQQVTVQRQEVLKVLQRVDRLHQPSGARTQRSPCGQWRRCGAPQANAGPRTARDAVPGRARY